MIFLEEGILLSKKHYDSWWDIQAEYWDTFKASLGPWPVEAVIDYIEFDYRPPYVPFTRDQILAFAESDDLVLRSIGWGIVD
jgi:hypothetical protein